MLTNEIDQRTSSFSAAKPGGVRIRQSNPWLILGLLYLLNTLLVLDKIVFTVLLEPIKSEFGLSDSALGLVSGTVYALCMGVASIPLGMLVDRYNRRNIAAACLAVWSTMTAACAAAPTYLALLLARVGVGLGEAGGGPASLSLISDAFEHKRRATAMAIFSLGVPTAALFNLTVITSIAHEYGWRVSLIVAAAPGLALALFMMVLMREPIRGARDAVAEKGDAPQLRETIAFAASQRSLVLILAAAAISYIVLAGVSAWNFSYLIRYHNASLHEIGPYLGISISGAGIVALCITGFLSDYLGKKDERWRCRIMSITTLATLGFGFVVFTTSSLTTAIVATAGLAACTTLWAAPGYALIQSLVFPRMRGTTSAFVFLLSNLVGYGVGPLLVGVLSDGYVHLDIGNPLQAAILTVLSLNACSVLLFWRSAKYIRRDLQRSEEGMTVSAAG